LQDYGFLISVGIITYFCPCYTFGKNAEAVGDSCCLCGLSYFIAPINLYTRTHIRGKVRDQKGIEVRE
jgi:Cys-rich protein (TIGR01571 family)